MGSTATLLRHKPPNFRIFATLFAFIGVALYCLSHNAVVITQSCDKASSKILNSEASSHEVDPVQDKDDKNTTKHETRYCSLYLKDRKLARYKSCLNCTSQYNQDEILRNIFDAIARRRAAASAATHCS